MGGVGASRDSRVGLSAMRDVDGSKVRVKGGSA